MKKPVVGPSEWAKYRLDGKLMLGVKPNGRSKSFGYYATIGEIRRVLRVLSGVPYNGRHAELLNHTGVVAYNISSNGLNMFDASIIDNKLSLGCTTFSKQDTKKIKAWANPQ